MSEAPANPDRRRLRRRMAFGAVFFCAACIVIAMVAPDMDAEVRKVVITQGFWNGMGVVGIYVFGAVWDDRGKP